jgi:hypothetical protein
MSRLPNFIIAGTFPAGTGQLYALMRQHPEVYLPMPMAPECNFFLKTQEYEKGLAYYQQRWFDACGSQRAVGERSSLLMSGDVSAERVREHLPDVRLIFLVRNPVDRAWANYRFTALAGLETMGFEEALARENERVASETRAIWREIRPHSYFQRGMYAEQLERFQAKFPPRQILVLRSDMLLRDLDKTMSRIFSFLGLPGLEAISPCQDFSSPSVVDPKRQSELRQKFGAAFDPAIQHLREGGAPRNECEQELAGNLRNGKDPISAPLRLQLARRYLAPNERFQALVDFSVEDWIAEGRS